MMRCIVDALIEDIGRSIGRGERDPEIESIEEM